MTLRILSESEFFALVEIIQKYLNISVVTEQITLTCLEFAIVINRRVY